MYQSKNTQANFNPSTPRLDSLTAQACANIQTVKSPDLQSETTLTRRPLSLASC